MICVAAGLRSAVLHLSYSSFLSKISRSHHMNASLLKQIQSVTELSGGGLSPYIVTLPD